MVCWNSRVETRAVRSFGLPNNGALTTACGDESHCSERHVESGEEPNGQQHRVAQGEPLGSDSQNIQDDGGHVEISGRPSVQWRSTLMKRRFSPRWRFDLLRRGILWHLSHGRGDLRGHRCLLVRALGVEQSRWRRDRVASRQLHAVIVLLSWFANECRSVKPKLSAQQLSQGFFTVQEDDFLNSPRHGDMVCLYCADDPH